jgi:hypothetical protein
MIIIAPLVIGAGVHLTLKYLDIEKCMRDQAHQQDIFKLESKYLKMSSDRNAKSIKSTNKMLRNIEKTFGNMVVSLARLEESDKALQGMILNIADNRKVYSGRGHQ